MKEAGEDVMEEASPNYLCAATPPWLGELQHKGKSHCEVWRVQAEAIFCVSSWDTGFQ